MKKASPKRDAFCLAVEIGEVSKQILDIKRKTEIERKSKNLCFLFFIFECMFGKMLVKEHMCYICEEVAYENY